MSLVQDCRIALRLFRRTPLATGIALASIALSVGAASVVFAAIKSDGKAIRNATAAPDPNQPVFLSASISAWIADSVADGRSIMLILAITAGIALVLAATSRSIQAPRFGRNRPYECKPLQLNGLCLHVVNETVLILA